MGRNDIRRQLQDHYLDFFSFAMSILKDEDDARDVVQEALTRTMMKLMVKDPFSFCMRTLKRLCIDTQRRRSRMVEIDDRMMTIDPEHEELLRIVRQKKEELSEMARTVLELHDEDGHTMGEVAEMLHVSPSTVKRILYDARYEMRKKLENEI
ncbi:MAG: RNA polymerase sigma factor [Bacteroidales bacterium]|nr:RNA polymerase sigma factor [Bacteroidales bacterium]